LPKGGAHALVKELRAVKDEEELAIFRRACSITDLLLEELRGGISSGAIETEADAALLVERRCRELGAEGTGFEPCRGPARSWGIHAFPLGAEFSAVAGSPFWISASGWKATART
jgi:hypothetical protein